MPELSFTPLSVRILWQFDCCVKSSFLQAMLVSFIASICIAVSLSEHALIGHIKGYLKGEKGCVFFSAISERYAPCLEGELEENINCVTLDFVVLVYGMDQCDLEDIIESSLAENCNFQNCQHGIEIIKLQDSSSAYRHEVMTS